MSMKWGGVDKDALQEAIDKANEWKGKEAIKHDQAKPRMELLSSVALQRTAQVMTFGAEKYESHNWRKGLNWSRLYGAAMRHLLAHMDGENLDPESGLSHLDHAACCIMFLQEYEEKGLGNDDRYIKG